MVAIWKVPDDDFWTRLEAKTEAIIDKHKARKAP
jgi:hypothetical protein